MSIEHCWLRGVINVLANLAERIYDSVWSEHWGGSTNRVGDDKRRLLKSVWCAREYVHAKISRYRYPQNSADYVWLSMELVDSYIQITRPRTRIVLSVGITHDQADNDPAYPLKSMMILIPALSSNTWAFRIEVWWSYKLLTSTNPDGNLTCDWICVCFELTTKPWTLSTLQGYNDSAFVRWRWHSDAHH